MIVLKHKKKSILTASSILLVIAIIFFLLLSESSPFYHRIGQKKGLVYRGVYFKSPVPVLILNNGTIAEGLSPEAILIGSKQQSLETQITTLEQSIGPLNGKQIQIKGTLYHADNKTIFLLSEEKTAIGSVDHTRRYPTQQTPKKPKELTGKVIEPLCWFDQVIKGGSEIHQSCTQRHLRWGNPPMLVVNYNGKNIYYLLQLKAEKEENDQWLAFAGQSVKIKGNVFNQNGWNVLETTIEAVELIAP